MHGVSQYNRLIKEKWIYPKNDGQFILSKEFQKIMMMFDKIIVSWAAKDNAKEYIYPDFYEIADLNKCGYIEQFHHHCLYAASDKEETNDSIKSKFYRYINNPAICMHSYIQYKNSIVSSKCPIVITAKGKCKRNERSGFTTLERMLDFTMREIVFIGSKDFVLNKRQEYIDKSILLLNDLNLCGSISLSSDPFYKDYKINTEFQRKFKLKYELNLINYDNDHVIAAGSFNYHNCHFSKAYNIRMDNNTLARTACIAFGLERLAYAFISQVGIDICHQYLNEYLNRMNI